MKLTSQQQSAFDAIRQFISGDEQVFILRGYAGTGKTTLIRCIAEYAESVNRTSFLMAPTGRAANVLRAKVGKPSTTIHRGIYNLSEMKIQLDPEDVAKSTYKLFFPIRSLEFPPLCIIDEASMLGNNLSEGELFSFGTNHLLDDVITFSKLQHGGKLILVGDPAQLPPVGQDISQALNVTFFQSLSLRVNEFTLTDVLRQDAESVLLANAMRVRDAYNEHRYNDLSIVQGDDISAISSSSIAQAYCNKFPQPALGNSVVICYSNRTANEYNRQIRQKIWGYENAPMSVGDVMMVISNYYDHRNTTDETMDIMNGEFVKILSLSNYETHRVPVYTQSQERIILSLTYVDATVLLSDGKTWTGKVITDPILSEPQGTISITIRKALYIDFCMRHPELQADKEDFCQTLRIDPFYNALKVRFGYAITCHKSQGGEWSDLFIDFEGIHIDKFGLRWIYTALTRARRHVYAANLPQVAPMDKLCIQPITKVKKPSASFPMCSSIESNIETPFHASTAALYLKTKYAEVMDALAGTGYNIISVQSFQYQERYTISTPQGQNAIVDLWYNKKGFFRAPKTANTELLALLSAPNSSMVKRDCAYIPSSDANGYLYQVMQHACQQSGAEIVGVSEFPVQYKTTYYLHTSGQFAWIEFFINKKGFITSATPFSDMEDDAKLQSLLNNITKTI